MGYIILDDIYISSDESIMVRERAFLDGDFDAKTLKRELTTSMSKNSGLLLADSNTEDIDFYSIYLLYYRVLHYRVLNLENHDTRYTHSTTCQKG